MLSAIISVCVSLLMSNTTKATGSLSNSYRYVMSHLINLYSSSCVREVWQLDMMDLF